MDVGLTPQSQVTIESPTTVIAPAMLVIIVTPQKLICFQSPQLLCFLFLFTKLGGSQSLLWHILGGASLVCLHD